MSLRSSNGFGMNSSFTPKRPGIGLLNNLRLVIFLQRPCSKVSTKHGVLGMLFVEDIIYILSELGDNNIVRWSTSLSGVVMVAWGLSSASGVGAVLDLVGPVGCPWCWSVSVTFYVVIRAQGAPLPLGVGAFSPLFNSLRRWLCWHSVSKKRE